MRNRIGVFVASLVLLRCAWDSVPRTQLTWHVWSRLRHAHRPAPDTSRDNEYASLKRFIPPNSVVGLVQAAQSGTPERERGLTTFSSTLSRQRSSSRRPNRPSYSSVPHRRLQDFIDPAQYAMVMLADEVGLYRRLGH